MKEITYTELNDYIEKSKVFDDPKIIKTYTTWNLSTKTPFAACKAITFLGTWLLQWQGKSTGEVIEVLVESGHKKGKLPDVVPMERVR